MDSALEQVVQTVNGYVGNLIDIADMSEDDRSELKEHLLEAEKILLRNGNVKLQAVLSTLTKSILSRLG